MAEPTSDVPQLSQEQQSLKEQFEYHSAMAFGEKPNVIPSAIADQPEPPNQAAPANDNPVNITPAPAFDEPTYLKEFGGWETKEAALAELQELRALKEKPQQPLSAELSFANDQSKKIHELLKEGKVDEVIEVYQTQKRLDSLIGNSVTKETAPDIIKLGMELSNKLLTKDEIEFQYKQEYGYPKEPVYNEARETEDEFNERHSEWKERVSNIEMKKIVAAKMAIPQLEQLKTKIELPNINPPTNSVDQDYEDWKASNAKSEEVRNTVIAPAINALKESDLQSSIKIEDPNNQMQFEVSVLPDSKDFGATKEDALNSLQWLIKTAYDDKGTFNPIKLAKSIDIAKNFDKYAQSIARQAVNAERKRVVAKESGGGIVRDFNTNPAQLSELQKEAEKAFAV